MSDGGSIVNFGELSKPATVLVEKICDAVGCIFRPYQVRRMAKAEGDAAKILASSEIEITELHQRAMLRWLDEEAARQQNIEAITSKAIPDIEEDAKPNEIEDDWLTNFFDRSRLVSNEEMQALWGRILAGEANSPGRFSKRTIDFLGTLDKREAHMFSTLCRFNLEFAGPTPIIAKPHDEVYKSVGLTYGILMHLSDIGLIGFNPLTGYSALLEVPSGMSYGGHRFKLRRLGVSEQKLQIGAVVLTRVGEDLASICEAEPVPGFVEYLKEYFEDQALECKIEPPQ